MTFRLEVEVSLSGPLRPDASQFVKFMGEMRAAARIAAIESFPRGEVAEYVEVCYPRMVEDVSL